MEQINKEQLNRGLNILVQKYGGTSVADVKKLDQVSENIIREKKYGKSVVVVVSAQGKTTNRLIAEEEEITNNADKREHDVLVSTGEQITISKLAMMLQKKGHKAKSYTGWQIPIITNSNNTNARIKYIPTERLLKDLQDGYIIVVAGFQGVDEQGNITTLGRGGSDTTAVALAAVLGGRCDIYTDVDGVLRTDPKIIPDAKRINNISYDEMLEFASMGAKVLHNRCVEIAKNSSVPLFVRMVDGETGEATRGTEVSDTKNLETFSINGITKDDYISRIIVTNVSNKAGSTYKLFKLLAERGIDVDLVSQSMGESVMRNIAFTVKMSEREETVRVLRENIKQIGFGEIIYDDTLSKITVIGIGLENKLDVAAKMFEVLAENNININMINTSEIKISVLVDTKLSTIALEKIYERFFPKEN